VWRKLHNEELHPLSSSPNIIRLIKIKKNMDRTFGTRGREERCKQGFCGGDLREKDRLDYLSVDGRIILIWINNPNVIHVRILISNQTTKITKH
jgi:hypothetical protein